MICETNFNADAEGIVPDIPSPPDVSPGGIVSWLLGVLCVVIGFLWRLNESKSSVAITTLSAKQVETEIKYEQRLTKAEEANLECQEDRIKIREQFAVLSERLANMEKQMVHKAG
jgi:Tfp pilus assembly protein PilO